MVTHNRQPQTADPLLEELAKLYGVQTAYRDYRGRWRESPVESIVLVLRALGSELGDGDAGDDPLRGVTPARLNVAIRERKRELWSRMLEPVIVAWEGRLPPLTLRLPVGGQRPRQSYRRSEESGAFGRQSTTGEVTLNLEDGATRSRGLDMESLSILEVAQIGHQRFEARRLSLPRLMGTACEANPLPWGYHRLRIELGRITVEATVLSAPRLCWGYESLFGVGARAGDSARNDAETGDSALAGQAIDNQKTCVSVTDVLTGAGAPSHKWGVFAPLYALRSERDWGAGDLSDLENLGRAVTEVGGTTVATLPLLASYLDRPFEPAPYRPVSRLFWNEFYLAVEQIPEWKRCEAARKLWDSTALQERLNALRTAPQVDYREAMALKRQLLEKLSGCFFQGAAAGRMEAFSAYLAAHAEAEEYAEFRAGVEAAGADWRGWRGDSPPSCSRRRLPVGVPEAKQYHLYCQWQMEEQLSRFGFRSARGEDETILQQGTTSEGRTSVGLFLDLPLGVHPGSYDTWRWSGLFVAEMSTGAPPDAFFALGQDWSLPPLNPERIRAEGHGYFARSVRHHMRHARYLRVDHIMSLHRLFWLPEGTKPEGGVYVVYPADESYAVLALESHRNRTVVVGEDLGTVPAGVRASMRRHGVLGTWVMQTSLRTRGRRVVEPVPRNVVASLNTHDMFPFAGFLRGDDIVARVETGQLERVRADSELVARRRLVARLATFLQGQGPVRAGAELPLRSVSTPIAEQAGQGAVRLESGANKLIPRALRYLSIYEAAIVLVNLEDLLGETQPQNMPGTGAEWGNWRRKLRGSQSDVRRAIEAAALSLTGMAREPDP